MNSANKTNRRQQILEVLALELEVNPGSRIYYCGSGKSRECVWGSTVQRYFSNKAKMFEALIDFVEDSVFRFINKILEQETDVVKCCEKTITSNIGFL